MDIEEELIKAGIFRDLRCPSCGSRKLSSSSGMFGEPMIHTCVECRAQCTDEAAVSAAQQRALKRQYPDKKIVIEIASDTESSAVSAIEDKIRNL